MAIKKLSDLTALTTVADDDLLLINDVSEALAINQSKKITGTNLKTYMGGTVAADLASLQSLLMSIVGGRLTLESGVPVSSSDQADKTTLYYTPYVGDAIALYDGSSAWEIIEFSELSLDISGFTASKPYDIFIYNDSGNATLEGLVWTNASTRATALAYQDGVLSLTGSLTRRYVGTIYIEADQHCDDTDINRNVWNMYNRVPRRLYVANSAGHNYNGTARLWNNSATNNKLSFITGQGLAIMAQAQTTQKAGADGNYANTFVQHDGATRVTEDIQNYNDQYIAASGVGVTTFAEGYHYIQVYEYGNHSSSHFYKFWMSAVVEG